MTILDFGYRLRMHDRGASSGKEGPHAPLAVALILTLAVCAACGGGGSSSVTPTPTPTPTPAPSDVTIVDDITYATIAGVPLRLDIVKPASSTAARMPLVVYVHGGGFASGDKSAGVAELQSLARLGYVGATINYRFAPQFTFPAQVQDVKAAVRFLRANAGQYGIDEARIAIWGVSSGGTLAALAGVGNDLPEWEAAGGTPGFSSRVQAVVTWLGTYDLLDSSAAARPDVTALLSCAPASCVTAARAASASSYVSSDDAAFFVMPGACPAQGQLFHSALIAAGVSSVLNLEGVEGNVPASATAATQAFLGSTLRVSQRAQGLRRP